MYRVKDPTVCSPYLVNFILLTLTSMYFILPHIALVKISRFGNLHVFSFHTSLLQSPPQTCKHGY